MRTFNEYVSGNNLAVFLVENQIDPVWFCEKIADLARNQSLTSEAIINEWPWSRQTLGPVSGTAQVAGGVGNVVAAPAAVAGRAIGAGARAAGRWIGDAASKAGKYIGDTYAQGKQAEALKQANNAIQGLQDVLTKVGFSQDELAQVLQPLIDKVKEHQLANQELGYRTNPAQPVPTPTPSTPTLATNTPSRKRGRPMPGSSEDWQNKFANIA